jgi:hypothetical protein
MTGDRERRGNARIRASFSAQLRPGLRFAIDSASSADESIQSVVISDMSGTGLAASHDGQVAVGETVALELPLIGWREAQIVWIHDNRIGCRFVHPLTQDELRAAVAANTPFRELFPGLAIDL